VSSTHVSTQGIICFVSPSPSTLFRFPPEAVLGKRLSDVVDIFSMWTVSGVCVCDERHKCYVSAYISPTA